MATRSIRLGSMLNFDDQQEKDILDLLDRLNASHKTGQVLSNLLRVAVDNPELLKCESGRYSPGPILEQFERHNQSLNRSLFFKQITNDINELKQKIDTIYNLVSKSYMLAEIGNRLGLEGKVENELLATFLIEKELTSLQKTLGVNLRDSIFASNKLEKNKETADDVVEYIINSYSELLKELKVPVQQVQVPVQQVVPVQQTFSVQAVAPQVSTPIQPVKTSEQVDDNAVIDFGDTPVEEDTNFDNADFDALSAFFGS